MMESACHLLRWLSMRRMLACSVALKIKLNILENSHKMNYTVTFLKRAFYFVQVPYVQWKGESQLIKVQIETGGAITGYFPSWTVSFIPNLSVNTYAAFKCYIIYIKSSCILSHRWWLKEYCLNLYTLEGRDSSFKLGQRCTRLSLDPWAKSFSLKYSLPYICSLYVN